MSSSSPYAPAARLLSQIWTSHKSLKTLAYGANGQLRCTKAAYAQVCHVLESKGILDAVMQSVDCLGTVRNEALLYVLLYELLLGPNRAIRGGGALKRTLLKKEADLRAALEEAKKESKNSGSTTVSFPRYVRVNTLQASMERVVRTLKSSNIAEIYADKHVPNLLVLPAPNTKLPNDLLTSGHVVLQDKSSCFSAMCLVDDKNDTGDCLDACAAPGNKTSHLAALVADKKNKNSQGARTIYALDRSSTRFRSLSKRMQQLVTSRVKVVPQHRDFLQTKPCDYKNVNCILLDPSCSGSGIFTSPDRLHQEENDDSIKRLQSLSNFQVTCLKHAMSFPQVQRIVYSTCSLHKQENELVVVQALSNKEWQVVAPTCLRHWKRRGHVVEGLTKEQAQCMIRANQEDDTNGFFVCCLERVGSKSGSATSKKESTESVFDPPEGLAFYSGQFQASDEGNSLSTKRQMQDENENRPKKKAKTAKKSNKHKSSSSSVAKSNDKHVSKKRAKKIAWKKRQMEQKQKRMQQKKKKKKQKGKQEQGTDTAES